MDRAILQFGLLLLGCILMPGCSHVCDLWMRTLRYEPSEYWWKSDHDRSIAMYARLADEAWAEASLDTLERNLQDKVFLLGAEFSAADIMVGYTVLVAKALGLVGEQHRSVDAYLARLTERPALRRALQA